MNPIQSEVYATGTPYHLSVRYQIPRTWSQCLILLVVLQKWFLPSKGWAGSEHSWLRRGGHPALPPRNLYRKILRNLLRKYCSLHLVKPFKKGTIHTLGYIPSQQKFPVFSIWKVPALMFMSPPVCFLNFLATSVWIILSLNPFKL